MAYPKPKGVSSAGEAASAGRVRKLLEMKGAAQTVAGKSFDIPKVDLIQSMFFGTDSQRAELKAMWDSLDREAKKRLYVQMMDAMPSPRKGEGHLSPEGQEILDFLVKGEIRPERAEVFSDPKVQKDNVSPSRTFDDVDAEADGTAAPEQEFDGLPEDDVRPGFAKRPLPDNVDLRGNNLHGTDHRRASSKLETKPNFRVEKHTEIVPVPGPDGVVKERPMQVIDDFHKTKADLARESKARQGKSFGDMDGNPKTFTDETGKTRKGVPSRGPADAGERSKAEAYDDVMHNIIYGRANSPVYKPTSGSSDELMTAYEMLRANPDSPFHADPRAAFDSPEAMAEALFHNMNQQRLLDAHRPVSPTARRGVRQAIEDENVGNEFLGLPEVSQGQAAQLASEMGLPTSRTAQRGTIEQQALDTIANRIRQRFGGSGWGRKYDADGNLVDPGVGTPDQPTGLPAVSSRAPEVESRLPDQPRDEGLEDPAAQEIVDRYHDLWDRQARQERLGLPLEDRPADARPDQAAGEGGGIPKDHRTPEQIARDNADKQAAWEGKRERAATRFNEYTRNADGSPYVQTRRTARDVQAEIDRLHEESFARQDDGPDPGRLAKLHDELRQAKVLDGLTSPFGARRKGGTGKGRKWTKTEPQVGTNDSSAVSTKGRQGKKAGPVTDADFDDVNGRLSEEASDVDAVPAEAPKNKHEARAEELEAAARGEREEAAAAAAEAGTPAESPKGPSETSSKAPEAEKSADPAATPEDTKADGSGESQKNTTKTGDADASKPKPKTEKASGGGMIRRLLGWGATAGAAGLGIYGLNRLGQSPDDATAEAGMGGGGVDVAHDAASSSAGASLAGGSPDFYGAQPMTSEQRIKLMQQLSGMSPNMNVQTAQNWRM